MLEKDQEKEDAPLITGVTAMPCYILRINLQNGSELYVNTRMWLIGARFNKLYEKSVWESVSTDGERVLWDGGIVMTMDDALEMFGARL